MYLAPGRFAQQVQPLDIGDMVQALADDLGGQVLALAGQLAPLAVPFALALAALAFVLHKFGVAGRVELMRLDREAAAQQEKGRIRKERAAARRAAKWDALLDDAYTENRRRHLRKRFTGSY